MWDEVASISAVRNCRDLLLVVCTLRIGDTERVPPDMFVALKLDFAAESSLGPFFLLEEEAEVVAEILTELLEDLVEEAEDRLNRRDVQPGEGFTFGAIDAAVTYLLPDILKAYLHHYPEVELSVHVSPSKYLVEELLANRSEFAMITLPYAHPKVETRSIYEDSMPLVVGEDHPFAEKKTVTLEEVAEESLILFHADSISRKIVDERFAEVGVSPRVVMELRSPEAMRKLVEVGIGISFLPSLTVQESLKSGSLKEIDVKDVSFSREIGVAWRKGRYFGPAIRHLLEDIFDRYGAQKVRTDRQIA